MTPSLNEEESNSTFEKSLSSTSPTCSSYISETVHNDRLVVGPDGNHILCDSPNPSQPPPYSGPDDISSVHPKRPSSLNKKHTSSTSNRNSTTERSKPKRVIGNYTLVNTLGSGSMGKVRLAVNNFTGDKV